MHLLLTGVQYYGRKNTHCKWDVECCTISCRSVAFRHRLIGITNGRRWNRGKCSACTALAPFHFRLDGCQSSSLGWPSTSLHCRVGLETPPYMHIFIYVYISLVIVSPSRISSGFQCAAPCPRLRFQSRCSRMERARDTSKYSVDR